MRYLLIIFFLPSLLYGAYYSTLPAGVRNFTYRYIHSSTIGGSFNSAGNYEGYNVTANINADVLKGLDSSVDTYLNGLSQSDYDAFSFGTFEGSATSDVQVHAFGGGYGLTDKITLYGFIPYYDAVVDLNLQRTKKGQNNVGSSTTLEGLPDIDIRIIQNLFVNYLNYQPLGKWEAHGFGDLEFGAMWNFYNEDFIGALINFGAVAPTGKADNPDILQDIDFGDGQWDLFYEIGMGVRVTPLISYDLWGRYTWQMKHTKNIRLPDSEAFPVTSRKGEAEINLGNIISLNAKGNLHFNDQWSTSLAYHYEQKGQDEYQSEHSDANRILAINTEIKKHIVLAGISYSTLKLYKLAQFAAPLEVSLGAQSIVSGENTPKYELYHFEFKLFF